MIESIKITNYLNEEIEFILTNPEKSGFYIREIEGIGSPEANINLTEVSTMDGALFNSARATSRNIVLTLGFLPKNTIEDVRHLSYKYFPIKKNVKLTFVTDNRIAEISGLVEKNTPIIFSERQTTQISILCPDPFFYSKDLMITTFEGVVPLFEFPFHYKGAPPPIWTPGLDGFSNESLTQPLLMMGEIWPEATRSILYQGDQEVGVLIYIFATGIVSDMTIFDPNTNQKMTINSNRLIELTGSGIVEGDQIIISTVKGNKFITLIRNGLEYNILNALNRDAYWFQLRKGDNVFAYTAEFGLSNIVFRIENNIAYEGV